MCVKIAYRFWKKRSTVSSVCPLSCEKSERNWHPPTSAHRPSQQFNISETLLRRILHKDLGMMPYTIVQLVQELKPIDHPMRSTYRRCRFWQKKIFFSDEAHFDLGGYVNKQNCGIWGTENPQAYIKKPTHPKRVTRILVHFSSKMSKKRPLQSMALIVMVML